MIKSNKKLAIDFDGTVVEDAYPGIGKAKTFAFETLKKLQSEGYRLILWTYRHGQSLQDAIEFCRKNGVEFYAVNSSFEGEVFDSETQSRKIDADLFIDDRNLGGFPAGRSAQRAETAAETALGLVRTGAAGRCRCVGTKCLMSLPSQCSRACVGNA